MSETKNAIKLLDYNIQGKQGISKDDSKSKYCKYSVLIPWAISQGYQIIMLQETKAEKGYVEKQVKKVCSFATVIETPNPANNNKGGVATICIDKNIRIRLTEDDNQTQRTWLDTVPAQQRTENDIQRGRYQTTQFEYKGEPVYITNIYAPSSDSKMRHYFYKHIDDVLPYRANRMAITVGDFNCVKDCTVDKIRKDNTIDTNQENVDALNEYLGNRGLTDTYMDSRDDDAGPVMMTNASTNGNTYSRIDRWYHNPELEGKLWIGDEHCKRTNPTPPIPLDSTHNPISLILDDRQADMLKQYSQNWRMNTSLALTPAVSKELRDLFDDSYDTMALLETAKEKVKAWETFKIQAANYMKKTQQEANKRIKIKEQELHQKLDYDHFSDDNSKETAQIELEQMHQHKRQGHLMKSITHQIQHGSKSTKQHFWKAKVRQAQSQITAVRDSQSNALYTTQTQIENETSKYWFHPVTGVMCKRHIDRQAKRRVINKIKYKLSESQARQLGKGKPPETIVSIEAIKEAIHQTKLSKAPGIDGLPIEFYEILLRDDPDERILKWLQLVYVESFSSKKLTKSMRKCQMRLLYKKQNEHDKQFPKNYRPIALLNLDYKILSKILANQLNTVMSHLLSQSQYCQKGKYIGDLIHLIQSIIFDVNKTPHQKGFLAFLDFEKAFDSVNHEFTFELMAAMNIPKEFITWIELAFIDTHACCIINGKRTKFYPLHGGGRQGDCVYPLIFALIMQAVKECIDDSGAEGILMPNGKSFNSGQYADDTTLGGRNREDYFKYKTAIADFLAASGMQINYGKSMFMWLGDHIRRPPDLANDPVCVLTPNATTRVLGIDMGKAQNPRQAWDKAKDNIRRTLSSKLRHTGNEIGDTVTVNAIIAGQMVFTASFLQLNGSDADEVQKWMMAFVRQKNYLAQKQKRHCGRNDGTLQAMHSIPDLCATIIAKFTAQIMTPNDTIPEYGIYWIKQFAAIAKYTKHASIDHLLLTSGTIPQPKGKSKTLEFQTATYASVQGFRKLGYTRQIKHNEDILDQPLIGNGLFINPTTAKPWSAQDYPFKECTKLKFVHQLIDFPLPILEVYRVSSIIPRVEFSSPTSLHNKFTPTNRQHPMRPLGPYWRQLIESIPLALRDLARNGTQSLQPGDLCTPSSNHQINSVYRVTSTNHGRILLQPLIQQQHEITVFIAAHTEIDPTDARFSIQISTLKRLRGVRLKDGRYAISTFMLPDYKRAQVFNYNILPQSYTHPSKKNFKEVTKDWRRSQHKRHTDISEFARATFNDPQYDLTALTSNLDKTLITDKSKEILQKIIYKSLYVGEVANRYQTQIKGLTANSRIPIVSQFCEYSEWNFAYLTPTGYNPKTLTGKAKGITLKPATYDHILWTGPIARSLWSEANRFLDTMQIPFTMTHWRDVLKFIEKTKHPTRNQHIYIAIITTVIVVLYSQEKKLNDLIGSEEIDDETIDRWNDTCLSRLRTQLVRQAFQLPTIMELIKMNTTRTVNGKDVPIYTQRDKHMRPPVDVYRVTLTPALIQAYQETWIQTKLVEITNGMLNFSPYRREPP